MGRSVRAFGAAGLTLAVALAALVTATYVVARRALPTESGAETVAGLHGTVEVLRDAEGVPHIYAQNDDDLFFAQGYVTAQDRLWQLEFNRRLVWGRLSELVGPQALEADQLFRLFGLGRAAADEELTLDGEARRALLAYGAGVNAYVSNHPLPLEFHLLFTGFEPWRPVDSLAWAKMLAWQLSGNAGSELLRAELVAKFGAKAAAELMPSIPAGVVARTAPEVDYTTLGGSVRERFERVIGLVRPPSDELGSNNWAISGRRTASGRPILANDPHLGVQLPPVWYEVHLVGGGYDVAGFSLPGIPGVIIGHNQRIAWAVTNAGPDVQDFFVERRHPEDPSLFLFLGQWEEAKVVREEVRVRGWRDPVRLTIPYTRHGPVLNADTPEEPPLALQWTALRPSRMGASVLRLNRARNWGEFREALREFDVPSQNFLYADVDGNIGHQVPGLIPIRAKGDGLLPVPGWTGEYEWTGYVPYAELPSRFNPPEGYLATANNRVVDGSYPYLFTYEWAPPFRVERISQWLAESSDFTAAKAGALQQDVHSLFAAWLVPRVLAVGDRALGGAFGPVDARTAAALAVLRAWNGNVAVDSPGASVYAVFYNRLIRNVFGDALGQDLAKRYLAGSRAHTLALMGKWEDGQGGDHLGFGDTATSGAETRDEVVWRSLSETAE
ncbi:MAG: penicillin acylase family protein, partial [Chloroflexota bacterium]